MSAFSQSVNYTGKKPKAEDRPQIGRNQAFSVYRPPARQGQAQPSYGATQQQGGFPSVPQQGQQSAPDMSVYRQQSSGTYTDPNGVVRQRQTPPANGYGTRTGGGELSYSMDFVDSDGDGTDDRYQPAPGQTGQLPIPPGTFVTPSGTLEQNYTYYGMQSPPATNYMPQQSFSMPPMNFGTRDAFIASINNSLAQQQANGFNTQGAAPPQFNFPALYQQANQMVANGWSNPLAGLFR